VGAPFGQPGHHRQHRRGAVQGLDLGFLVYAQHQRLFRRIQIQPDDVADLVDELRIVADLERIDQVRFEPEGAFQIRPTVDFDNPLWAAIDARDQCVASAGWRSRVATKTCSICSSPIVR